MIRCPPKYKLEYKRRKCHHALQRHTTIGGFDQSKETMSSFLDQTSPSPVPVLSPTLAVLLNRTDAPMNPTRSC